MEHSEELLSIMEIVNPSSSSIAVTINAGWFLLFFIIAVTQQSLALAARNLGSQNPPPPPPPGQTYHDQATLTIRFSMPDVLSGKKHHHPTSKPAANSDHHLPFSKPVGYFPPIGGIPFANLEPGPMVGLSSQTLDLDGISMSFPAAAALQELELGTVTKISEDIYDGSMLVGKAQGIYVASSEDGNSHMMAMTASFISNGSGDCLRLFGVHRTDAVESHVAVIGGSGKYHNANGFATVKTVNIDSGAAESQDEYKLLLFSVNLG